MAPEFDSAALSWNLGKTSEVSPKFYLCFILFIQRILFEHLWWARHYPECWRYSNKQMRVSALVLYASVSPSIKQELYLLKKVLGRLNEIIFCYLICLALWIAVNFIWEGLLSFCLSEIPFLSLYPLSLGMSFLCAERCPRLFSSPSPMSFPPGIGESETGAVSPIIELSVKRRNLSRGRCCPTLNQDQMGGWACLLLNNLETSTSHAVELCVPSCYLLRPNESQNE